ncbi:DUF6056 family protein [Companilactobacillus metriopterae]|uniref:DUF6056 family protein n=1 Tax=Companilactobacillus metriopterae TaxID=1909267 RepID=UPI001F5045C1|nr:DUF6056 family protein [Companilactobacillus metriopterae]
MLCTTISPTIQKSFTLGSKIINKKIERLTFIAVFIYYAVISVLIIPSADDYFWWGYKGLYLLRHNFFSTNIIYDGSSNGRYLGNLSEILIMHSPIFAVLFYALVVTLVIWCIYELTGRNAISLIMSILLFFILQIGYLQSVFLWYAGFVNYLPPMALLLLDCLLYKRFLNAKINNILALSISLFVISLCGGLFVEHVTLYQLLVGVLFVILIWYLNNKQKFSKIYYPSIAFLLGAILSASIMFSNPSYYHHQEVYRKTGFTLIGSIHNYIYFTHFWIATFNYLIIIILCISIAVLALNKINRRWLKISMVTSSIIFVVYYIFINIYLTNYSIDFLYEIVGLPFKIGLIDSFVGSMFYIFLFASTIILFRKLTIDNIYIYFYLFSSVALFVPFIFILAPVSAREYFGAFIFLFMLCIIYLNKALSYLDLTVKSTLQYVFSTIIVFSSILVIVLMSKNAQANISRVDNQKFLYEYALLKKRVPYEKYVFVNDEPILQAPEYYRHRLKFTFKDYIYNNYRD